MSPWSRRHYASMWETASWPKHQTGMPSQVNVGVISQAILLKVFNSVASMAYEMPNSKLLPKYQVLHNSLNARLMPRTTAAPVWGLGFGVWGLGFRFYCLGFRPFCCRNASAAVDCRHCAYRVRRAAHDRMMHDADGDPERLYISIIRRPTGPRTRWHLTRLSSTTVP